MLAFLSHVCWVPKAHIVPFSGPTDFVVAIPTRQTKRISVTSLRASLSLRKIGGTNTYVALRKANARPVHILYSYSLLPFPLCLLPAFGGSGDLERERRDRAWPGPAFPYNHSPVPAASEGRQPPLLVEGYLQLQLTYGYNSIRTKFPSPVGVHLTTTDSAHNQQSPEEK